MTEATEHAPGWAGEVWIKAGEPSHRAGEAATSTLPVGSVLAVD